MHVKQLRVGGGMDITYKNEDKNMSEEYFEYNKTLPRINNAKQAMQLLIEDLDKTSRKDWNVIVECNMQGLYDSAYIEGFKEGTYDCKNVLEKCLSILRSLKGSLDNKDNDILLEEIDRSYKHIKDILFI